MAIFNDGRKVIDVNPNPALKFVGWRLAHS